jgi:hypothetical protein
MSKKFGNLIIFILVVLLTSIAYDVIKANKGKSIPTVAKVSVKAKDKTKIELWNEKVDKFMTEIKNTNKLLVLEGTTDVSANFDTNEPTNESNLLKWCKAKLANLDAKVLTVETKYKFGYSYDLSKIVIEKLKNNKIKITVYQSQLLLEYLQEIQGQQIIKSEKGIFATQFTPQQVVALTDRVNTYTHNNIINNKGIRLQAIESTKANILSIAAMFDFKDIEVELVGDGLLESDTSQLNNIDYVIN